LDVLLADAIYHAENGILITAGQEAITQQKINELKDIAGFSEYSLVDGNAPKEGSILKNVRLAQTF
jgi:gamma-glutamyltranspeptidase/glutathione hydrolase